MNKGRFAAGVAMATGFIFLCGASGVAARGATLDSPQAAAPASGASATPMTSSPMQSRAPRVTANTGRPRQVLRLEDYLAGMNLTDEQKAKIDKIQRDMKAYMDKVAKDDKENEDQKAAMTGGLERMQSRQIFAVLTPEQRVEVRKKVIAERTAELNKRQQGSTGR